MLLSFCVFLFLHILTTALRHKINRENGSFICCDKTDKRKITTTMPEKAFQLLGKGMTASAGTLVQLRSTKTECSSKQNEKQTRYIT